MIMPIGQDQEIAKLARPVTPQEEIEGLMKTHLKQLQDRKLALLTQIDSLDLERRLANDALESVNRGIDGLIFVDQPRAVDGTTPAFVQRNGR